MFNELKSIQVKTNIIKSKDQFFFAKFLFYPVRLGLFFCIYSVITTRFTKKKNFFAASLPIFILVETRDNVRLYY